MDANEYLRRGQVINAIRVAQGNHFSQAEDGAEVSGSTYLEIAPSRTALPASYPFRSPGTTEFFRSTTPLINIRRVCVRRHNGRCLGMYLSYEDSTIETLGQWDPRDSDSIWKI